MGMSYLLDTHILVWWLFNDPKLNTDEDISACHTSQISWYNQTVVLVPGGGLGSCSQGF